MVVAQHLPYFDPRTLSKLEGLTLRARGTVEGAVTGAHRSPFHGFAAEFAEHREYAPGDDLRYVDWKVYGRSDRVFVKQFEEETNFACHVLLDASESMSFRSETAPLSKLEFAKHVAAAISYVVVKQQDAMGLITFDRKIEQFVRPGSQPAHWKQISHVLEQTTTRPKAESREPNAVLSTSESVLTKLAESLSKRGVVIVLSDLFAESDSLMRGLKRLRHRKHDLRVWQIVDPAEEDFPFDDPTLFHGLEGWADLSVEPRLLRTAYQREFVAHRESLRRQCRDVGIDFCVLRTDMPVELALRRSGFPT
ncbi:hypothetical protein LBMAG52_25720 [Planctomycetia bacterium]|nr:hypothetical protein LBMAG52_25720 [Planctomycetia bacterium]